MKFLEWLAQMRTPVLDRFDLIITNFGSELIAIAVICVLFWAIDKKKAYRIGFVYFISGLCIQILKVVCKVPRPWIKNPEFAPVEEAIEEATGYSFPSGHTQNATALYSSIAWISKNKIVVGIMSALIVFVGFSRMYLGVHTPQDVLVSFAVTLTISIAVNIMMDKGIIDKIKKEYVALFLLAIPVLMVIYGNILLNAGNVELENMEDYFKAAGAALGFAVAWYLENKYVNFDEKRGSVAEKVIRCLVGIVTALALKSGFKALLGGGFVSGFVQYAILVFYAVCLYPIIVEKISHCGKIDDCGNK